MKATPTFEQVIQNHLQQLADKDPLFAETLAKPNKNIKDCANYILGEVQKTGCNGFADEEIYQMAVHYYDEDDIKPTAEIKAKVIINQSVPASPKSSNANQSEAIKPQTTKKPTKSVVPASQSALF